LVNAIRVIGHVNNGVGGGGIERAVMPVAAAVHLCPPPHRQPGHQHGDTKDDRGKFHAGGAPLHRIIFHKQTPETAVASMVRFLHPSPPKKQH
jgi:hypothetical protein